MGKIEAAREDTIAAWQAVERFIDTHEEQGELRADEQRELDRLTAEAKQRHAKYNALRGTDAATPAEMKAALDEMTSTKGVNLPFGRAFSAMLPGRPTMFAGWADAVVKAYTKDLLPQGSVPVTVPITPEPIVEQRRVVFLRQLLPTLPTAADGRFEYFAQTTRTNNAAVVADLGRKPTSVYSLTPVDDKADVIAHLSEPMPRFWVQDAPMLRQFINDELTYGLALALDAAILDVITDAAGSAPAGGDALESARKAITALQQADFEPTGFVMSPQDWETVELTAAANFAANPNLSPTNPMTRRLYGVPVVVSTGMSDGTALLGDFSSGAALYLKEDARIDWSENIYRADLGDGSPGTDFERNAIVFRAEMRAKAAVLKAPAFVTISFGS